MARINLLPWREERRKARQKEFIGMLGLAVVAGVLLSVLIVTSAPQAVHLKLIRLAASAAMSRAPEAMTVPLS